VIADNRRTQIAGRRGDGLARDLVHVDTIIRRWQALTGSSGRHGASGRNLGDLLGEAKRANAA
jgi:hypothetical protein